MNDEGLKHDEDKDDWSLLPQGTIVQVVKVLVFGAKIYKRGNWKNVHNARHRYYSAVNRHIEAWWTGEKIDDDSKLQHLAHAVCCLLFLMWFDLNTKEDK